MFVQYAGLSRVAENFALECVLASMAQRKAEESYGIPRELQTRGPWTAIDFERLWLARHKELYPWYSESGMSTRVPRGAFRARAAALKNWVASRQGKQRGQAVRIPRFRTRKDGLRFLIPCPDAYPIDPTKVQIPRVGHVSAREDMTWLVARMADGRARVTSSTVREQAGRWWVSFAVEIDREDVNQRRQVSADAPTCGIDLGVKTLATIMDDTGAVEKVVLPPGLRRSERKLRRAQKAFSRKMPGSANHKKARTAVAAAHMSIRHRRHDFVHKLTTRLARTKRAIAVESLNVVGMLRNHSLHGSLKRAGFAEFVRILEYKASWYGSKVWAADRWYPSSRTCSECGRINQDLTLKMRTWTCACGRRHDRDTNAARNLLVAMNSVA